MKYEMTENLTAEMFNDPKEMMSLPFLSKIDQIFREMKSLNIALPKVTIGYVYENKTSIYHSGMTAMFQIDDDTQRYFFIKFAMLFTIPYIELVAITEIEKESFINLSIDPSLYKTGAVLKVE